MEPADNAIASIGEIVRSGIAIIINDEPVFAIGDSEIYHGPMLAAVNQPTACLAEQVMVR